MTDTPIHSHWLPRLIQVMAWGVVVKTTIAILLSYGNYLPPDFTADFLLGRRQYFFGAYAWAFYSHLAAGPFCLLSGSVLMSGRFRRWRPAWHRRLGKAHLLATVFLLAPSGLFMSCYAMTGPIAGAAFALQSAATAWFALASWLAAVRREFDAHRRWTQRLFALLISAVVIRVIGGTSQIVGGLELYAFSAWFSWLAPLALLETARVTRHRSLRRPRLSASPEGFPR